MLVIGKTTYPEGTQQKAAEMLRDALLRHYLGVSSGEVLFRDFKGRPRLRIPQADISTSHAGGIVFAALCFPDQRMRMDDEPLPCWIQVEEQEGSFCRIGIDIEPVSRANRDGRQRIADRWFDPEEAELLRRITDDEACRKAFLRIWTQKESVCKMTGDGLSAIKTIHTMALPDGISVTSSEIETSRGTYLCSICTDRRRQVENI